MTTIVLSFLVTLLLVGMMSIGVLMGRKPITGSCGGMKALGMGTTCDVCGGNPARCDRPGGNSDPGIDATRGQDSRREF
jgi:uncharacterized protein